MSALRASTFHKYHHHANSLCPLNVGVWIVPYVDAIPRLQAELFCDQSKGSPARFHVRRILASDNYCLDILQKWLSANSLHFHSWSTIGIRDHSESEPCILQSMNRRHCVREQRTCSSIRLPILESYLMNPCAFQLRQAELFEHGLPPNIPIVQKFSAMHFQIDEPEPSEQVRIGNLESIPAQPFRKDGCDRPETL